MNKLIGIFGGTFDPVHMGHVNAVNELHEEVKFERVHWVLSARPPHKNQISASIRERFDMLRLALSDYSRYYADDTEIKRQEKSWTIDTVMEFEERFPGHPLALIIGGDSLLRIPTWHRAEELVARINLIVMARPGYELKVPELLADHDQVPTDKIATTKAPTLTIFRQTDYPVSSTYIRELLGQGGSHEPEEELQDLLPAAVIHYIQNEQSYKIPS
ncbi:MAG: nicotinate (nicotinamide) nucleotide adenylyltransferase [Pseudomonadota bacterium]